jgi:hypothetical protein
MFKKNAILIFSMAVFMMINTAYFWEGFFGPWGILIDLMLIITYIVLIVYLLLTLIKKKSRDTYFIYKTGLSIILLGLIAYRPFGLINFEQFESKDLLIAEAESTIGCTTVLKLKEDSKFLLRENCWGVYKYAGNYTIKQDTAFLSYTSGSESNFCIGVFGPLGKPTLKPDTNKYLHLHKSKNDKAFARLWIEKNQLFK